MELVPVVYADWDQAAPLKALTCPYGTRTSLQRRIDVSFARRLATLKKKKAAVSRKQRRLECQATLAILRGERPEGPE